MEERLQTDFKLSHVTSVGQVSELSNGGRESCLRTGNKMGQVGRRSTVPFNI